MWIVKVVLLSCVQRAVRFHIRRPYAVVRGGSLLAHRDMDRPSEGQGIHAFASRGQPCVSWGADVRCGFLRRALPAVHKARDAKLEPHSGRADPLVSPVCTGLRFNGFICSCCRTHGRAPDVLGRCLRCKICVLFGAMSSSESAATAFQHFYAFYEKPPRVVSYDNGCASLSSPTRVSRCLVVCADSYLPA